MKKLLLGTICAAALSATPLWAQDAELFGKLDTNKDGTVTADEVEGDAKGLFERLLQKSDKDGDKKLTKEEFTAGLKETDTPRQPLGQAGGRGGPGRGGFADPRQQFNLWDRNKDGKITKDELPELVQPNFDRLDADKDGSVTQEELARMARRPDGAPGAGANPEQLAAMFDRADANKDGKLTKDEIPEDRRERFAQALERLGGESMNKEQFQRFAGFFMGLAGRPVGEPRPDAPPGGGRMPLIAALDADSDGEISASEIEAASKALRKLDKNSDGKLTREEMFPGGPDRPPQGRPDGRPPEGRPGAGRFNPEEMQARIKAADTNGDGKLSKDEIEKGEVPPALKERFDAIDANSDGQIDDTELRQDFERRLREGGDRPPGRPEGRPDGRRPEGDRPPSDRPNAPPRE